MRRPAASATAREKLGETEKGERRLRGNGQTDRRGRQQRHDAPDGPIDIPPRPRLIKVGSPIRRSFEFGRGGRGHTDSSHPTDESRGRTTPAADAQLTTDRCPPRGGRSTSIIFSCHPTRPADQWPTLAFSQILRPNTGTSPVPSLQGSNPPSPPQGAPASRPVPITTLET